MKRRSSKRQRREREKMMVVWPSLGTRLPSWLPIKNRIPPQCVCVFTLSPAGCLPQHNTVTPCLSSAFSFLSWLTFPSLSETCLLSTCGTCPWQVKMILHHRNWAEVSTMHPLFLPVPPFSLIPPPIFHSPSLNIELPWQKGARGI